MEGCRKLDASVCDTVRLCLKTNTKQKFLRKAVEMARVLIPFFLCHSVVVLQTVYCARAYGWVSVFASPPELTPSSTAM